MPRFDNSPEGRRRKYALFNLITSVLVQAVNIVVGLLIPRALISVYGDEVNGLISTVTQVFNFFQLLEGGVSVAAAVALYKPFAEGDTGKISGIFRAIAKYYKRSGEILLLLSLATGGLFAFLFRESPIGFLTIMSVVMITGVMNSMNFLLLGKFNVICDADQHTFVLHMFTITARVVVSVLQYVFIMLNLHIIIVELPLLLMVGIRLGLTYFYVKKRYPYVLEGDKKDLIPFNQKNDALVIQICNLVKRNAPMLVIAFTGNLVMLSIYNIYAQIFHATSSLFEMSSQSLTSNFGNLA
ncbi:MAG: hypothetical protein IJS35_03495, partial [Firmicutes bacterium]|nr:hypothetical protein [Bacillota bacterium]